jgi:hypothetical protein
MKYAIAVVAVLLSVACGGTTPTSPSPVAPTPLAPIAPSIAGAWTGTVTVGTLGTAAASFTLTQSDRTIGGTWAIASAGNDAHGVIAGTVTTDGRFDGTLTWDSTGDRGGRCEASGPTTGTASAGALTWAAPRFDFASCTPLTDVVWAMRRQ